MASKSSDQIGFWQAHVEKYKASGLSRAAYCREHGLTFYKLTKHLGDRVSSPIGEQNAFARVVTTPSSTRSSARLSFGGGVVLEVESGTDPAWLAGVIAEVGRLG